MSAPVLVVTGSRADFGLLLPVMSAVDAHPGLTLRVAVTGTHTLPPATTIDDVRRRVRVDAVVPMQEPGRTGRPADARALGRGVSGFADLIGTLEPGWVVVLGDRVEAFAAAAAASVGGVRVAHIHGGDRAEGIADESMRHAISKLAHLHLPATVTSAQRLIRMGEDPAFVRAIGSTAVDAIATTPPMSDADYAGCGSPDTVVLLHPVGRPDEAERTAAAETLAAVRGRRVLALHPNFDAGRLGIVAAMRDAGVPTSAHMERDAFLGLLKRLARTGGVLVGNSSAGLIEAAAVGLPAVDIGPRQTVRERADNVVHAEEDAVGIRDAVRGAEAIDRGALAHPFGDGHAGERAAAEIAACAGPAAPPLRKRNTY